MTSALVFELQGGLAVARNLTAVERQLPTIHKRAIVTVRRRVPVQARRDIQAEYSVKAQRLSQDLGARDTSDGILLTGYFRGIGLRNFGSRQTRAGVTAAVFRGQRTLRQGAFHAHLPGGGEQAVRREGDKRVMTRGRYAGQRKQPIVVEYGPSAAQMLRKGRRPERLVDFARGVLSGDVARQIDSLLKHPKQG